jgi:cytochrome oxidase Cu insertion factor (SCO1/SenC/PrrC family)
MPMRPRFSKPLLLATLLFGLPLGHGCSESLEEETPELAPLWDAPTFTLTDQDNKPFGTEQLKGKPWIGMLFFTTCSGPCPMMAMRMKDVQDALPDKSIKIVSFSVDPHFDTPPRLKEYADRVKATPGRWYFLTGNDGQIEAVADGPQTDVRQAPRHRPDDAGCDDRPLDEVPAHRRRQ